MGNRGNIKYYAQELKENTYNLTRMNLIMRGILPGNIVNRNADTLEDDWPYFDEQDPVNGLEYSRHSSHSSCRPKYFFGMAPTPPLPLQASRASSWQGSQARGW